MASAIAPPPKLECHPSGRNCDANIVDLQSYRNSSNSRISDCCWAVVVFNNHSSIINKSALA